MMKKIKPRDPSETEAELAKLRQTFQQPAIPDLTCPEPEQVISSALQELPAPEQQQIQEHLLTCRDCLELYLDVRSARAEAESPADRKVNGIADEKLPKAAWLAVLGQKIRETLQSMGKPRRLIPALAAVSLMVLVVILGREEKSRILPPPQLAMEKQTPPTVPFGAAPSQAPDAVTSIPAPPSPGLMAARPQAETAASFKKKSLSAAGALAGSIHLDFAEVPDDGARFSYRANRDSYAYLFRQDQNGKFSLLYSGVIEAGKTYYYPDQDHLLKSDVATTETTVFLVASATPVIDVEARLKEVEGLGKDQMRMLFPQATIKSLLVRLP